MLPIIFGVAVAMPATLWSGIANELPKRSRQLACRCKPAFMPGDTTSEWVMVARSKDVLDNLRPEKERDPNNYRTLLGLATPPSITCPVDDI